MKHDVFELSINELQEIGTDLQSKIADGLKQDGEEIACLPTYITPGGELEGKVLALDWGGTNFRAAIVLFEKGKKPVIMENLKKPLSCKETEGFSQEDLWNEMALLIGQLKDLDRSVTHIGYCFSYPAESTLNGDAILLRWTKEINIPDMVNKLVGKPLMEYLNRHDSIRSKTQFTTVKVVNDTIACLFAGLAQPGYDSYIGLIVGTGTNMAGLIHKAKISKLNKDYNGGNYIPVNLESGNLQPKHLTVIDERVDKNSREPGKQMFEKAISGGYLGAIFRHTYPDLTIESKFDGEKLSNLLNFPDIYKDEFVYVARSIYARSAELVAASLAGLILILVDYQDKNTFDKSITDICLAADGSLFWSVDQNGKDYHVLVKKALESILDSFGLGNIYIHINQLDDANLTGAAIATLS